MLSDQSEINRFDLILLDRIQGDFPLEERPFTHIAEELDSDEKTVIERLRALKENGVVRQISAIFDSVSLGYKSVLLAMQIPPDRVSEAAQKICLHPGITHCYERRHRTNLWSTLTVSTDTVIDAHANYLTRLAGSDKHMLLRCRRHFKIDARFPVAGTHNDIIGDTGWRPNDIQSEPLTEHEIEAVRILQRDIPLVPAVFDNLAEHSSFTAADLIALSREFLSRGIMRRFSAVLRHQKAGYTDNVMCVWIVPEEHIEQVGLIMASVPEVSHCAQRVTWPEIALQPLYHDTQP